MKMSGTVPATMPAEKLGESSSTRTAACSEELVFPKVHNEPYRRSGRLYAEWLACRLIIGKRPVRAFPFSSRKHGSESKFH
jgi:hypothetical protein